MSGEMGGKRLAGQNIVKCSWWPGGDMLRLYFRSLPSIRKKFLYSNTNYSCKENEVIS